MFIRVLTLPIVTPYFVHVTLSPCKGCSYVYKSPGPQCTSDLVFNLNYKILDKVYQSAMATRQHYKTIASWSNHKKISLPHPSITEPTFPMDNCL